MTSPLGLSHREAMRRRAERSPVYKKELERLQAERAGKQSSS